MEDTFSSKGLYAAVLKDFNVIKDEDILKTKKENEKNDKIIITNDNKIVDELLKACSNFLFDPSISKAASSYYYDIYVFVKEYLNNISEFLGKETY